MTIVHQKNTHLYHLDEMVARGIMTQKQAVLELKSILDWCDNYQRNSRLGRHITIKYDGSPAVFFGKHPTTGQFIIGTKSMVSKKEQYATSLEEIISMYPRTLEPQKNGTLIPELVDHFSHLFTILSNFEFDAIYQGDLLYTPDTLRKTPSGSNFEFKPNTLTYKVLAGSELGKKISECSCGLVVHTKYTGETLRTMRAEFLSEDMSIPGIWSPPLHRFGNISIVSTSSRNRAVSLIETLSKKHLNEVLDINTANLFCVLVNALLREKKILFPSIDQIMEKIRLKNEEIEEHNSHIRRHNLTSKRQKKENSLLEISYNYVAFYRDFVSCKNRIIKVLNDCSLSDDISIYVSDDKQNTITHHEGYVIQSDYTYKLVNRGIFSLYNFLDETPWKVPKQTKKPTNEKN